MAFHFEDVPVARIVCAAIYPPNDVAQDHHKIAEESARLAEESGATIYRITDFRAAYWSFSDIIDWMARDTNNATPGSALDPRVKVVIVGNSETTDQMIEWMKQDQYGGLTIPTFDSTDDALAYVNAQLAQETPAPKADAA